MSKLHTGATAMAWGVFGLASITSRIQAQEHLGPITAAYRVLASVDGSAIWPGFRPDTIPVLYVLRQRGSLLLGWKGQLPDGFAPVTGSPGAGWREEAARGAASTSVALGGRSIAQVVVDSSATPVQIVALTAHEAFHAFQQSVRSEGRSFGGGENSFLVTTYPVFNPANEAAVALEGRLLRAALEAPSDSAVRELAAQFLAVRHGRQRRLPSELVTFEVMAELNEGLAEYAGIRAVATAPLPSGWTADAARIRAELLTQLDQLITDPSRSFRLRFYSTGPAMALLLDRLVGPRWKAELADSNRTMQDQLAFALDYFERERRLADGARARFEWRAMLAVAERTVASLLAMRRAQVDSVLSAPGILLVVEADRLSGGIGMCGIDPQNLLQVERGVLLHTRWLRPCAGRSLQGEFTTRVVHDQQRRALRAVIGPEAEVHIKVGGQSRSVAEGETVTAGEVEIEAPGASIQSIRAELQRTGRTLILRLLPPG